MDKFNALPENTSELPDFEDTAADKPVETVAEEMSFEDTLELLKLKDQILRYNISFGKYLQAYTEKIANMDDLELEQIKKLHREISIAVSARTSGNLARTQYTGIIRTVEFCSPALGFNLRGLTDYLSGDEAVQETIEELNIKYDVLNHISPEVRLVYLTLNAALAINKENQKFDKIVKIMNEPVNQQHLDQFQDL